MATVIYGPRGSGKTANAEAFARHYGCTRARDYCGEGDRPPQDGELLLTQMPIKGHLNISVFDALGELLGPNTHGRPGGPYPAVIHGQKPLLNGEGYEPCSGSHPDCVSWRVEWIGGSAVDAIACATRAEAEALARAFTRVFWVGERSRAAKIRGLLS